MLVVLALEPPTEQSELSELLAWTMFLLSALISWSCVVNVLTAPLSVTRSAGLPSVHASILQVSLRILMQGVLLAVRLWARMPAAVLKECAILPQQSPQPPRSFFTATPVAAPAPVAASAAFFAARHLAGLSEALVASSLSHPRIHSMWLSLLALLLPGFTPTKVRRSSAVGSHAPCF